MIIQVILLAAIGLAGWFGPAWNDPVRAITSVVGVAFIVAGGILLSLGGRDLGAALTPLPRPKDGSGLVQTGIYARVRHPMYGGLILAAFGWALLTASIPAAVLAAVLWAFFRVKSGLEERWLAERFPDYASYRTRTRRLIPWIG